MFYYLYQIRNVINNKIYIGVHQTDDMNDGYFGSGKVLRQAIEKYGIEHFEKTILETFNSFEDALLRESEIVNEQFLLRDDVYNLRLGGKGGWEYIVKNELHKTGTGRKPWNKGKKLPPVSDEVRQKTSETMKKYWSENTHPRKGKGNWLSGTKGQGIFEPWNKGKEMPKHPCPKCGKEVSQLNMKRWHGDRCKNG